MNAHKPGPRDRVTTQPWRAAAVAFVLLYCPLLAWVFSTISFSAEDNARHYIDRVATRAPAPPPPLPVVHAVEWPDIVARRDPFQAPASAPKRAPGQPAAAGATKLRQAN